MLIVAPAPGYESLVSVPDADAYHARMGNELWIGSEQQKETWLRRATQYVLANYSLNATYLGPVHPNVEAAVAELALRAREGPLYDESQQQAGVIEETIGPITTRYAPSAVTPQRFALIDALLSGLVSGRGQIPIFRA